MNDDLGPKPDARIEPGEVNPGGVDAVDPDHTDHADGSTEPTIPDLPTDKNPAVRDEAPDEVTQDEDTATEATEASGSGDEQSQDDGTGEASA